MKHLILLTGLAGGMFAATAAFASGIPANTNEPQPTADATVPGSPYKVYKTETAPVPASPAAVAPAAAPAATPATAPAPETRTGPAAAAASHTWGQVPQPATAADTAPATNAPAVVVAPATLVLVPTNSPAAIVTQGSNTVVLLANGEKGLKMNFRGVPLEAVLNYMSDAAGFIIHPKVDVRGKVDVWSNQPLTSDESVKLLKQILNENGYTAIQDGRTLTIIKSDDAKKSDIPVMSGNDPDKIPKNADIVTQIIPVHTLNVVQLLKDLQPLLPSDATLTADESASSLVMTDTQMNIRRITEIVKALDSVTSSSATIRVFPLVYADAKSLASLIKDLFPSADASKNGSSGGGFSFGRFRGGSSGGFPGLPGFGGGESSGDSNGHTPTAKVSAVADDHSNSLIVSAPDGMMDTIAELVHKVDTSVADTTEVHLFQLKNADPVEMADLLSSLFPEDTSTTDATRAQPRFGFGFGGFGGAQTASSGSGASDRMKKMSTVVAVADRRTASLVVTAGKDLMPAISNLVSELDLRTDHKQSAHIIPLANADPVDVQQILQEMFQSSSSSSRTGSSSANSTTGNPLLNRQTTLLQQQNSTSSSSFGAGSSGGSRIGN